MQTPSQPRFRNSFVSIFCIAKVVASFIPFTIVHFGIIGTIFRNAMEPKHPFDLLATKLYSFVSISTANGFSGCFKVMRYTINVVGLDMIQLIVGAYAKTRIIQENKQAMDKGCTQKIEIYLAKLLAW